MIQSHVRVELVNVRCLDTEDVTGADTFYVVGGLTSGDPAKVQGQVSPRVWINDGETKPLSVVFFDGLLGQTDILKGGLAAFDEDFAKDWSKQKDWIAAIVAA